MIAAALVAIAILALSACGGSGGGKAASTFATKANAICANASTAYAGVLETIGDSYKLNSSPAAAGIAAGEAKVVGGEIKSLKAIESVAPSKPMFAKYIGTGEAFLAQVRNEEAAATNGDLGAFTAARSKATQINNGSRPLAAKLDLSACANHGLSAADIAAIRHVATATATVDNTSECTKTMTRAFVKELYGSLSGCIRTQEEGAPTPKSISLTKIEGAGDFAGADATLHGGKFDGQRNGLTFYRQGGSWRLQSLSAK